LHRRPHINSPNNDLPESGLPNPNLRNQGFSKKNQEFIRRNFLLNQEKNQEDFFTYSRAFT
jgi:hypothetical protein